MLNLPRIFTICSNLWLTNNEGICQSATLTLKSVIDECIALAMSTLENAQKHYLIIEKVFTILQNGLRLQFQNVWKSVFRLLNLMYKVKFVGFKFCLVLLAFFYFFFFKPKMSEKKINNWMILY